MTYQMKTRYFADRDSGVVVAEIVGWDDSEQKIVPLWECASDYCRSLMGDLYWLENIGGEKIARKFIRASYRGKATLCRGDVWNEFTGRRIARARGIAKYMKALKKYLKHCENVSLETQRLAENRVLKAFTYCDANIRYADGVAEN